MTLYEIIPGGRLDIYQSHGITPTPFSQSHLAFAPGGCCYADHLVQGSPIPRQYLLGRAKFITWCLSHPKGECRQDQAFFMMATHKTWSVREPPSIKWPCVKSGRVGAWINIKHINLTASTSPQFFGFHFAFVSGVWCYANRLGPKSLSPRQYLLGRAEFITWPLRHPKMRDIDRFKHFL